jgi:hypothetical protein
MRKTSVYLSDEDRARLARLATTLGRSQAEIVREGLRAMERATPPGRQFATVGIVSGDGTAISEIPEEELLKGFGDDSRR